MKILWELRKRWRDRLLRYAIDREVGKKYKIWFGENYPKKTEKEKFLVQPKISVIIPVFDPNPEHFKECLLSVINQSYENWEFCLVDDHSTNNSIRDLIVAFSKRDKRIKYFLRKTNGHISRLAVIKRGVIKKVGGFRTGFEGSQDWDLFLRLSEKIGKKNVIHIPK